MTETNVVHSGTTRGASSGTGLVPQIKVQDNRPVPNDNVNLRLLVIAADEHGSIVPTITNILDAIGVPYDLLIAARGPISERQLWYENHARYQGVILETGDLKYLNLKSQQRESAFADETWQMLWHYEARFGVRQVTWFTIPGEHPDRYGLDLIGELNATDTPLLVTLTDVGRKIFWYLNPTNSIALRYARTFLTRPRDAATTTLLRTPDDHAVAAITRYADGRENLALTVASNPNLIHSLLLGYGLINWVSRGLFLGERHVYLSPQIDDFFFRGRLWDPRTRTDETGAIYRNTGADIQALVKWLDRLQTQERNTAQLRIELAFNGEGAVLPPNADTLVSNVVPTQEHFLWVNHTFRHPRMDECNYETSLSEIRRNNAVAQSLALQHYSLDSLVTPEFTGLDQPEFMRAARDAGLRYLVSDTSRPNGNNPTPNTGIVSPLQPEILIVPRHPTNLWYNVGSPAQWVSEYNYIYRNFWKRDLAFAEILDWESDMMLQYLLKFDIDPIMFHQINLHTYDGIHSLMSDLIDRVIAKYNALYGAVPICSLSLHDIGEHMRRRAAYNTATIHATLMRGKGLSLQADRDVVVPLTGVRVDASSEFYGGQSIADIALKANQTHSINLSALVGYDG